MAAAGVDPVSLGQRYQEQLKHTYETLKEGAVNFKQVTETTINLYKAQLEQQRDHLQPQAKAMVDDYKATVTDLQSPIAPNVAPFLMKSYLWTSVCLVGFTMARMVSGVFLSGLLFMVFDTWVAMLLTYAALPAFVFLHLRKTQLTEVEREQVVLYGAVAEGALVGALFSNRYLTITGPPMFVLPCTFGLMAHLAGTKESITGNHRTFLGALVGGGMVAYLLIGFAVNLTFQYLLCSVMLGAAAAADLQLKLASFQRGDTSPQLEQWKTVVIMTVAGAITHYMASSTTKEDANESSAL